MIRRIPVSLLAGIFMFVTLPVAGEGGGVMKISSPAFENNNYIPKKYSGEAENVNPPLNIDGVPGPAKSLVLIVDDPDAPMGTWLHWAVFDIPVTSRIAENSIPGREGLTSSGRNDYSGPYPPFGVHRYFFKIYALDAMLDLKEGIGRKELEKAMEGHILDQAQLIGLYKRR